MPNKQWTEPLAGPIDGHDPDTPKQRGANRRRDFGDRRQLAGSAAALLVAALIVAILAAVL
jgi:hypothetical protein